MYTPSPDVVWLIAYLLVFAICLCFSTSSSGLGRPVGVIGAATAGFFALVRLSSMYDAGGLF